MEKTTVKLDAPIANKVAKELTQHGDVRVDNYYWLRDMDRKDPEIIKYLEDENGLHKKQILSTLKNFKKIYLKRSREGLIKKRICTSEI